MRKALSYFFHFHQVFVELQWLLNGTARMGWLNRMTQFKEKSGKHKESAEAFGQFLETYPNSKYAADAQKRMLSLKNRLARYSIQVAEYYIKMNAWSAAAVRAQSVLETYPGTPSTERALEIMAEAYGELGQNQLKQNVLMVMQANFPNNEILSN